MLLGAGGGDRKDHGRRAIELTQRRLWFQAGGRQSSTHAFLGLLREALNSELAHQGADLEPSAAPAPTLANPLRDPLGRQVVV